MSNFRRVTNRDTEVHFSKALFGEVEQSRMLASPLHLTTLNAGDIVPVYCREVLPHEHLSLSLDFDMRQTTIQTPTMGTMYVDYYAFWVPNRVVNQSFKAVMGENYNGSWTGNPVTLAPLVSPSMGETAVQIPVGSVADYYGFATQSAIPVSVLSQCHDLKFRGYVMIYNEFFRDQNYQPPIPMSTLNVYQGFLDPANGNIPLHGGPGQTMPLSAGVVPDGSYGAGAVANAVYGSGVPAANGSIVAARDAMNAFKAYKAPLKANKLHDYFTSVLPSPQRSPEQIFVPVSGTIGGAQVVPSLTNLSGPYPPLMFRNSSDGTAVTAPISLAVSNGSSLAGLTPVSGVQGSLYPSNLRTNSQTVTGLAMSIEDLRMSAAIQQVYEALGRGGSRYREYLRSFFGLDVDDPFNDIPKRLGHIRRSLDLFQTAQTAPSSEGSTPQGNLAAFGYTSSGGKLFDEVTFLEHGYIHVMAVVRHKNIYPSFMARDNFRLSMLDFYHPQLANISEQPIYLREINPFADNGSSSGIGFQEAWAEYRYEPDYVTGYMRPGSENTLAVWNYADESDINFKIVDGEWLKSNSQEVLDRTLAISSELAPQFKLSVKFYVDKTLPMPTYSVPGLDMV
ncbi:MAG: major capsid protein [Microviridae sp.]|nr:MAG: major capsid protein [Microviridae sp.]